MICLLIIEIFDDITRIAKQIFEELWETITKTKTKQKNNN